MSEHRFFRALVCFLLICCILINCSPIRAKAVVTEAIVVTGAGVFATMFAIAMGIVAVDLTVQLINGMGKSMENFLRTSTTGTESEILDVWIEPLQVGFNGDISQLPPEQDPNDSQNGAIAGLFSIPEELLDNLLDWGKSLINADGIEVDGEAAPEGYMYFNGVELPALPTYDSATRPYLWIYQKSDGSYFLAVSSFKAYIKTNGDFQAESSGDYWGHIISDGVWLHSSSINRSPSGAAVSKAGNYTLIWSNYDIQKDGATYMVGTEPVPSYTVVVEPDIYVGDIPQQVKDGTFDEEKFVLPYINYSLPFQGQTDPVTALNNVATQLQNQTMTYDQYMEQIRTEVDTGGGSGGDGSDDDNSSTTPVDPVPDISPYALQLIDFFPFCIPFDIYDFFSALIAEPEAPKFHWELQDLSGRTYAIDIDLSPWNGLAATFRSMQLLLFIVGLAVASRKFIKW